MRRVAHIVVILVTLVLTCVSEEMTPGTITEVSLAYGVPFVGKIYAVWLKADGTAVFRGDRQVARLGVFQAKFPKGEFEKRAAYLRELDYTSLKKDYNWDGTDGVPLVITIRATGNISKEICLYNPENETAPPKLWAIKRIVDSIIANFQWQDDSSQPAVVRSIVIAKFNIPEGASGPVSLQRVAEHARFCSHEFDPDAQGVNIILDVSEGRRTRETISIDPKNQTISQILNPLASQEGFFLTQRGRTILVQDRQGSL